MIKVKTKIYVSGKYIQRNKSIVSKKRKKTNIVERKRARKERLRKGVPDSIEEVKPEVVAEEVYLGKVLHIDRDGVGEESHEAHIVDSDGNVVVKVVYDPSVPRGAKVWIETEFEVKSIINKY